MRTLEPGSDRESEAMPKRDAPATHRNREPILAVLSRWLTQPATILEIASGTGQHAVFFAERLPHLDWQPSERDPEGLESIEAWVAESSVSNVARPVALDVCEAAWPVNEVDAVFNANMIHIAPWEVALGLFEGAGRVLRPGGLLFLYGPFRVAGEHTAPSNAAFDADLRRRDPRWGVRDLEEVEAVARRAGLSLVEHDELPANNRLLVFRRDPEG
jgi:SAM-dependent methyltransferase